MNYRITDHPVIDFPTNKPKVTFTFNGKEVEGLEGEPIIVSLRASGIIKLKEGTKKHTPYGPFCMQGRCCSCAMTVDKKPNVMTCVTPLKEGMSVKYMGDELDMDIFKKLPTKRIDISPGQFSQKAPKCELAIIGAGPAGMEAALMAKEAGVKSVVLFDDKEYLGGQLRLQTHTFFGNKDLGASIRGYEIANHLRQKIENTDIDIRLGSTVVGLYPLNMIGFRDEDKLNFIMANKIICATGASERFLPFPGNCLPGVMGAGGAQTFMNIHGVKPGKKVLVVGGGNIGVILAYQLIQAGIEVACVIEASAKMGAYEVHVKKLQALGVPLYTNHTIKQAQGKDCVEGATIVELDKNWQPIKNTEKTFSCDTICLAVGLSPLNELLWQAGCEFAYSNELGEVPLFDKFRQTSNRDIFVAGDCAVIGEASIARLEGRIAGLKASLDLSYPHPDFNLKLDEAFHLLDNIQTGSFGYRLGLGKNKLTASAPKENFKPQKYQQKLTAEDFKGKEKKILINCHQDIPCNPCEGSCHLGAIKIGNEINQQPSIDHEVCKGCGICLTACPGRAIRLVQYNYDNLNSLLTIPFEFYPFPEEDAPVEVLDQQGQFLCLGKIKTTKTPKDKTGCGTVSIIVPKAYAFDGVTLNIIQNQPKKISEDTSTLQNQLPSLDLNAYVCRCEEVTYQDVLDLIKNGVTNINDIKRLKRVGMGQCRGLSCTSVIENILKQELKQSKEHILNIKKNRRTMYRPPIKRITLGEAAKLKFSKEEIKLFEGIETVRTIPQEIINTFVAQKVEISEKLKSKYVIIGGGITGIFTAWWLAKLGASDITVIESNFLSSGQTGACLGGIRTGFNTKGKVKRAQKGLEVYQNAFDLIQEDVGWYQGGYAYLSFDEATNKLFNDSFTTWNQAQVSFQYLTDKNTFNQIVPGVDSERVSSMVYFPESGGANPFRATYMFAKDAQRMGVKIYTNHEVIDILKNNQQVSGVIISDKEKKIYKNIACEHVINCAGTSSVRVAKMVGIDLSGQVSIERHGAFITEKMPLWLDPLVVSYHPELSGYWQQKRMEKGVDEGEIVACYSSKNPIIGFNTHSYIYFLARMAKAMLLCQPSMADIGIIRNFAEHYVGRQSGIPIIGDTPVKGFWLNIAKKGHGFMCAPGDGYALAKSILDGKRHEWINECTLEEHISFTETMK